MNAWRSSHFSFFPTILNTAGSFQFISESRASLQWAPSLPTCKLFRSTRNWFSAVYQRDSTSQSSELFLSTGEARRSLWLRLYGPLIVREKLCGDGDVPFFAHNTMPFNQSDRIHAWMAFLRFSLCLSVAVNSSSDWMESHPMLPRPGHLGRSLTRWSFICGFALLGWFAHCLSDSNSNHSWENGDKTQRDKSRRLQHHVAYIHFTTDQETFKQNRFWSGKESTAISIVIEQVSAFPLANVER